MSETTVVADYTGPEGLRSDDPSVPRGLAQAAKAFPAARLVVVHGAHHDVLNDLQHRSVAAEVVTFLKALRNEPSLEPIITVGPSAW